MSPPGGYVPPQWSGSYVAQPLVHSGGGRSKLVAALLALFLGGLGIHKFYLGRTMWGIIYLLFCWTFIPAIIGFVEALWLLTMSEDGFHQRYP